MKKIDALTTEQAGRMKEWADKWIAIGLSTEPADFEAAEKAALKSYALCNLDKPMVILRTGSPLAATIAGALAWRYLQELKKQFGQASVSASVRASVSDSVSDSVWASVLDSVRASVCASVSDSVSGSVGASVSASVRDSVSDSVWDSVIGDAREGAYNYGICCMWAAQSAWISFFRDVCSLEMEAEISEKFDVNETLVKSCGWTWWHENVLAISDRPLSIKRDAEGRLHCENGPSMEYRDGWKLYHWHGVAIPGEWVTGKPPSAGEALTWANIEQRRAACEIVGWKNILAQLDAKIIHQDDDAEIGTLLEANIPDSGMERFLQVRCGTGRDFVIPVPREMQTALEANAWTYGLDTLNFKPEVRT